MAGHKPEEKKSKSKKGGGKWMEHLKKFYAEEKKKNPNYKYKDAMKDAKKTYKK